MRDNATARHPEMILGTSGIIVEWDTIVLLASEVDVACGVYPVAVFVRTIRSEVALISCDIASSRKRKRK